MLTRLMCSSFTDGAAAVVLGGPGGPRRRPRRPGSSGRWPARATASSTTTSGSPRPPRSPGTPSGWGPATRTWWSCTTPPRAEEIYALESLGFFGAGEAGPATEAGATRFDTPGLVVNSSGGLVGRGHPLGATGLSQVVELATQFRGRAGDRQVDGAPRLGVAINTGGIIYGDAGIVCIHGRPRRDLPRDGDPDHRLGHRSS